MALSVLVVLLLAVLYEGIKVGKAKLLHKTLESLSTTSSQQLILEPDQDSRGSESTPANRTPLRYEPWVEGWPVHSHPEGGWVHPENFSSAHRKIIWAPRSI